MKFKRIVCFVFLLSLILTLPVSAGTEIVKRTDAFYVADYANVLSSETEQYICSLNAQLEAVCGGQIVVVTIQFLNDLDSEQYAYQILKQWSVGDKQKNNGCVLLLVPGEEKYWLTVGYGIEEYFTSSTLDQILSTYLETDFDKGNYDSGVISTVKAVADGYDQFYGVSHANGGYNQGTSGRSRFSLTKLLLFLLVAWLLYRFLFSGGSGGGGYRSRNNFFIFPGFYRGFFGPTFRGSGGFGGSGGFRGGSGGFGGMGRGGGGGGHGGGAGRR